MLRIGEIVTNDGNFLMNVSENYKDIVIELSKQNFKSGELAFLACLVLSQTEKQYKNYLIKSLLNLGEFNIDELIADWQNSNLNVNDTEILKLLTEKETFLLRDLKIESHLEDYEDKYPDLFYDGFDTNFYPTKKKGTLYIRRLASHFLKKENLSDLQKLVLHFNMAQLLINWEPSCIHLGKMILENWNILKMNEWFSYIWPFYFKS